MPGTGYGSLRELEVEAIHEFDVRDMPVTVAVDVHGEAIHRTGPATWKPIILGQHNARGVTSYEVVAGLHMR